jgi:glycosyltransferase involved in cell wall biosynthesis
MKILIIMDPGILVPPKGYGGHERLVAMFAKEYERKGHEVHLLVTTGSYVQSCTIHPYGKEGFPPKKSDALKAVPVAWEFLWRNRNKFDLIHNFGRLIYLLPVLNHPVKKIMTYGREVNKRNIRWINLLPTNNLMFTGCSNDLVSRGNVAGKWCTVYNAIDFQNYQLQTRVEVDAPLIFLGRIEKVKGCHTAIAIAKATNHKLIIAGNISPLADEQEYFEQQIRPYIDGEQIIYVGQVNDQQKNELLGSSKALLFPIEWNEPFGMVMIEAMACGTPVVAFNRGSVPEVVLEGETGFVINDGSEMTQVLTKLNDFNRSRCRQLAISQFNVDVIASRYLSLFEF